MVSSSLATGQLLQLLESCSDMVLQCSDGRRIPCVRYHLVTTCEAIRHVTEDIDDAMLDKDERGRTVVPFPNVDASDLAIAVEVVHGVTAISELCEGTAPAALRGLRALGMDALDDDILGRIWELVRGDSLPAIRPHMDDLLHTPGVRTHVLRRLVVLCPTWTGFATHVLRHVAMDVCTASWMLHHLTKFYPAGLVFGAVLEALPRTALADPGTALRLFTGPRNTSSYHPAEALDVLRALGRVFAREGWDATQTEFFGAMLTAMSVYDVAPHVASDLHGSIVLLDGSPTASVLLFVHERKGAVSRKLARWLKVRVDWATGVVDARISFPELDRAVRRCEVRLVAYEDPATTAELWYECSTTLPSLPMTLSDHGQYAAGDVDAFRDMVRSDAFTRLRIDVFYAGHSVLKKAIF